MCYGKDHSVQVVCPKDDVERKSTKDRSAEVTIENLKSVGRIGYEIDQAIQLIEKPNRHGPFYPVRRHRRRAN